MVFEKKGRGEEFKSALDNELTFKANIIRNKIVGRWIGENLLKYSESQLEDFIERTIDSDFEEKGYDDVLRFFEKELKLNNLDYNEDLIKSKMDEEFQKAYTNLK